MFRVEGLSKFLCAGYTCACLHGVGGGVKQRAWNDFFTGREDFSCAVFMHVTFVLPGLKAGVVREGLEKESSTAEWDLGF